MPVTNLSEVMSGYLEPWRQYHDISHPERVIRVLKMLKNADYLPSWMVDFAWYHDSILIPGSHTNELDSSKLFLQHIGKASGEWLTRDEKRTVQAILQTATPWRRKSLDEITEDHHPDIDLCVDADCHILGEVSETYLKYIEDVEMEIVGYLSLQDPSSRANALKTFLNGRYVFLDKLVSHKYDGGFIFRTPVARQLWEERALSNIKMEITLISKRLRSYLL